MATFRTLCVLMSVCCTAVIWAEAEKAEPQILHRQKREWIIPAEKLYENVDYTKKEYIAKIRSDEETRLDITYSLIVPAVDQGLFTVGEKNGHVKIHGILDREKVSIYNLKGRATLKDGSLAEKDIDLRIIVLDQNDCTPEFKIQFLGSVHELSDSDTLVIIISAVDADQEGTDHSRIAYEIIQQEPAGESMFKIERSSGEIKVRLNTLDRETRATYKLLITGTDMNGFSSDVSNKPLTGTGTVTINILDVNDNIPVLEKNSYEGSVEENTIHVEALRIKAIDMDEIYTENWEAVYTIISGNEGGYFNITTDSKTNEGILMVTKELDYEMLKQVNLNVVVSNKAAYHKSVVLHQPKTYPIKINVVNVPEPPRFHPAVKVVSISEDRTTIDLRKAITTYTAIDSDTLLTATNVKYYKGQDFDNWVSIDKETAEIRLNKYPDRESQFLVNGTYYVKILCITDEFSAKTATGTIAIQVEDFNDHCPTLTSSHATLCHEKSVLYVTATDGDNYPNAEPFAFTLMTGSTDNWIVEHLNETTVILRSQNILWPGPHTVELDVKDQQGKSCEVQKLQVKVCTCNQAEVCMAEKQILNKAELGAGGVLALLLGILLLCLIPLLLLFCQCGAGAGTFTPFPFEHVPKIMSYHTEGQGEYKEFEMAQVPINVDVVDGGGKFTGGWKHEEDQWLLKTDREYLKNVGLTARGRYDYDFFTKNMALSEAYLRNYYVTKTQGMVQQETSEDLLLASNNESCKSVTGSLEDICSSLHDGSNLDFLEDLGVQFRRLAEISHGSAFGLKTSSTSTTAKSISSSSQVGIKMDDAVKVDGAVGGVHSGEMTSVSASGASSSTQNTTSYFDQGFSSRGATSTSTVGQTVFVQQPTVLLSSTPMYMVEQHPPTLLLASGPVLGVQESNLVLVEKAGTNMALTAQELQHANTRVLVNPGIGGTLVHGVSGHSKHQGAVSGTVQIIESQQVQSMEPVHVVQSSTHSSVSSSHSSQGQSGGIMGLRNASVHPSAVITSKHDVPLLSVSNGGAHTKVQEERVSLVEKSFQSSSTS